jgi:Uncharacterized protein conserved in bacteria (DUF2188)
MSEGKALFVGPQKGGEGWQVKKPGNERASAVTPTQQQAIERGRELATQEKSELVVQGRDGQIRQKDSHGNDPSKSKG